MYLEFLLRRAHSLRRVERMYCSGLILNSLTMDSKEVTVGTTGPMGSGLPQFGFPRRFAIALMSLRNGMVMVSILERRIGGIQKVQRYICISILRIFSSKINSLALFLQTIS